MFALEFGEGRDRVDAIMSSPKWLSLFKANPIQFVTLDTVKSALFLYNFTRYLFDISILKLYSLYCEEGRSNLLVNLVISVYKTSSAPKSRGRFFI